MMPRNLKLGPELLGCLTQHSDGDVGVIIGVYEEEGDYYYDVLYFEDGLVRGLKLFSISSILS